MYSLLSDYRLDISDISVILALIEVVVGRQSILILQLDMPAVWSDQVKCVLWFTFDALFPRIRLYLLKVNQTKRQSNDIETKPKKIKTLFYHIQVDG